MTIDYYYMDGSPPCAVVTLTVTALGIEAKVKQRLVDEMNNEHLKEEFLKINPQHTAPAIVDDGFGLSESRAIAKYLAAKYGNNKYYPQDVKTRALVDQRLDFDIGTLYPKVMDIFYSKMLKKPLTEDQLKKMDDALSVLNMYLKENKFVVGAEPTLADFSLGVTVALMEAFEINIKKYTNVVRWLALVKSSLPKFEETITETTNDIKEFIETMSKSQ
ncbi:Glutathione S-transferase 1, isoform D [Papilio machaon]|uniref:Glutathione S-transferase 1, isoform D n=1 Tax=Papilio machaon TaxID=76193 RepID=A0A194R9F3_PAPMA|nr:Glutathione S-transferase 1, isoform D [Papilio machaon]